MSTLKSSLSIKARSTSEGSPNKVARESGAEHGPVSTGSGSRIKGSLAKKKAGTLNSANAEKINAYS